MDVLSSLASNLIPISQEALKTIVESNIRIKNGVELLLTLGDEEQKHYFRVWWNYVAEEYQAQALIVENGELATKKNSRKTII